MNPQQSHHHHHHHHQQHHPQRRVVSGDYTTVSASASAAADGETSTSAATTTTATTTTTTTPVLPPPWRHHLRGGLGNGIGNNGFQKKSFVFIASLSVFALVVVAIVVVGSSVESGGFRQGQFNHPVQSHGIVGTSSISMTSNEGARSMKMSSDGGRGGQELGMEEAEGEGAYDNGGNDDGAADSASSPSSSTTPDHDGGGKNDARVLIHEGSMRARVWRGEINVLADEIENLIQGGWSTTAAATSDNSTTAANEDTPDNSTTTATTPRRPGDRSSSSLGYVGSKSFFTVLDDDRDNPHRRNRLWRDRYGNYHKYSDEDDDDEEYYRYEPEKLRGIAMKLRIRGDSFHEVVRAIASLANGHYGVVGMDDCDAVTELETATRDATEEYVDAASRAEVLRASRDAIKSLLENAQDIQDVIRIQQEMNRLTEAYESQKNRANKLMKLATLSTLSLRIEESPLRDKMRMEEEIETIRQNGGRHGLTRQQQQLRRRRRRVRNVDGPLAPVDMAVMALEQVGSILSTIVNASVYIAVLLSPILALFCVMCRKEVTPAAAAKQSPRSSAAAPTKEISNP